MQDVAFTMWARQYALARMRTRRIRSLKPIRKAQPKVWRIWVHHG